MTRVGDRQTLSISVGHTNADLIGSDHRALQAAVDYVASLGGGTVRIGPGEYEMRDALNLRSNVAIAGDGAILVKPAATQSPLALDGDYGEEQITLENADGFRVGNGVSVGDDDSGGFHHVVATLLWQNGNTFGVSKPMNGDYLVSRNACATTTFPVISGYYVESVTIEGVKILGNKQSNPYLTGCRGAGIFLYRSHGTVIRACEVRNYSGDGISFQQSNDVTVEHCFCRGNTHLGLHPGSGSGSPTIRQCRSEENGRIGLFLCWRVRNGVFEDNALEGNGETGISIGHKDTDNTFRRNRVIGNGMEGILFRDESEPMAGHRNTFVDNDILDNRRFGVRILGETRDLTFERNRIKGTGSGVQSVAIHTGLNATPPTLVDNELNGKIEHTEKVKAQ